MPTIIPDLSKLSFKEENSLNNLLASIDVKLAKLGQMTWESVAFGTEHKNCKPIYDDLIMYRDIITQKVHGCGCYDNISMQSLISKIKQLTA